MLQVLTRNIASNWASFAVQIVVVFYLTPIVLGNLGPERYSVWALVTGLTGYYGLLNLGFRAGLTQYLTRYLANRDFERMNATASTGFVAMACCAVLVAVVSIVVAWLAPIVFQIPDELTAETRWCILVIGLSTAAGFTLQPFAAVFPATQQFVISNGVFVSTYLLSAVATFIALYLGHGLVAISVISAVTGLIQFGALWRLAYRVLPELVVSPRLASREEFWPMVHYGGWTVFIRGASILKSRADVILIGLFLPIEALAPYALALSLAEYLDRMFTPIGFVLFPAVTDLDARGDAPRLKTVYVLGSKMLMLLALGAGVLSIAWASDFFRLWIKTDVTANGMYPTPTVLYYLLALGAVCTASQRISLQICLGTRRMKSLSILTVSEALLRIAGSVVLIQRYGLIGIAVGTLLPTLVCQMFLLPAIVNRILDIDVAEYFRVTCMRPLLALFAIVVLILPTMYLIGRVDNWRQLFFFAAITGLIAGVPLITIGLNRIERRRFVLEPITRAGRRLTKRLGRDWVEELPPKISVSNSINDAKTDPNPSTPR